MWFLDVVCDFGWFIEQEGHFTNPKARLSGRSDSQQIDIVLLIYGDDFNVRHLRVLLHTDDQQVAQACVNANIQAWIWTLETATILTTGVPFSVATLPNSAKFCTILGQGGEDAVSLKLNLEFCNAVAIDYTKVIMGLANWGPDLRYHLFYFRRFIDESLPLDFRWLNGYKMFEWHFTSNKSDLPNSAAWREFLERFRADLSPYLKNNQKLHGLIEQTRALVAHASLDDRSPDERAQEPHNLLQITFPTLEKMVMTLLNEHPARMGQLELVPKRNLKAEGVSNDVKSSNH
ncbi:hypothetical protein H6G97_43535 [Nostoc flagelliforme FACHB-838]|uniref:ApeA N-terminal domain-containing protein n=1 Tax=Nostoc flagelliforme FACHB-838 TaxID=2692904 RepID=A0ABR8E2W4_9NOSO|nr:hypothetical protein [Nostoc flagelliforme]MBD2535855.1 hypothetical protein [Nostoc flagelliforme FACHB-838]